MNTTMILSHLAYECLERALREKQSFVSEHTFLREHDQVEYKKI